MTLTEWFCFFTGIGVGAGTVLLAPGGWLDLRYRIEKALRLSVEAHPAGRKPRLRVVR